MHIRQLRTRRYGPFSPFGPFCFQSPLGHRAVFGTDIDPNEFASQSPGNDRCGAAAEEWIKDESSNGTTGLNADFDQSLWKDRKVSFAELG